MVDRNPWLALIATVALQSVAMLGLCLVGQQPAAAVGLIALAGLAFAAFTAALGSLVLQVAPGRSDLALPVHGVNSTVLIGALLGLIALGLALGERLIRRGTIDGCTEPARDCLAGVR